MATHEENKLEVSQLYVATFNRASEADGLDYWVGRLESGTSIDEIARLFFIQPETLEIYPPELSNEEFVQQVYNNLFNRDSDPEGLAYWVGRLDEGSLTRDEAILKFIRGAQGTDEEILDNKAQVGVDFADSGLSDYDQSKEVMEGVDETQESVDAANEKIAGWVGDDAGQEFNTTLNVDTLVGTDEGNDIFTSEVVENAVGELNNTLQNPDFIDGKDGEDTLNAHLIAEGGDTTVAPTVKDVETLNLRFTADDGEVALDLDYVTGAEEVNVADSRGDTALLNARGIADFSFTDSTGKMNVTGSTATELDLEFTNAGRPGENWDDAYMLNIENNVATEANINLTDSNVDIDIGKDTLDTVNILSQGTNKLDIMDNNGESITDVNIEGSGVLELDGRFSAIENLDATGFADDLDIQMGGAEAVSIMTGDGANVLDFNEDLKIGAEVSTGAGSDTVTTLNMGDGSSIDTSTYYGTNDVNTVTVHGSIGSGVNITTGNGADTVTIDQNVGDDSIINVGNTYTGPIDNADYVTIHGNIGNNVSIFTGEGSDHVTVGSAILPAMPMFGPLVVPLIIQEPGSMVGNNFEIDTTSSYGDYETSDIDTINIYGDVGSDLDINTGDGSDYIHISDAAIGDGNVGIGANITTGTDVDTLVIDGNIGDGSYINMGDGSDTIEIGGNLYSESGLAQTVINTEFGDDDITIGGNVGSHAQINTSYGNDDVVIDGNLGYSADINTGTGYGLDTVTVNGNVDSYATIQTGYDRDIVTVGGNVGSHAQINTSYGDDDVVIDGDLGYSADINTGAGYGLDTVTVNGNVNSYATIQTGNDKDTVNIYGNASNNVTINTGDGEGLINMFGDYTYSYDLNDGEITTGASIGANSTIVTGQDVDKITLDGGESYTYSYNAGGTNNGTTYGATIGAGTSISTGDEGDIITLGGGQSGMYSWLNSATDNGVNNGASIEEGVIISTGEGNDMLTLEGGKSIVHNWDNAFNNSTNNGATISDLAIIDTGDGNDTITLKAGSSTTTSSVGIVFDSSNNTGAYIGEGVSIITGEGNDTLTVEAVNENETSIGEDTTIDMGNGVNTVNIGGNVGNFTDISTGDDIDTVNIGGDLLGNNTVNTGNGNASVEIGGDMYNSADIITGTGVDMVDIGGSMYSDASISVGAGDDEVTIGADGMNDMSISIDGGEDIDTITLRSGAVDDLSENYAGGAYGGPQVTNFENLIIDFGEDTGMGEDTYDMSAFDNINNVTLQNGSVGEDTSLINLQNDAVVTLDLDENTNGSLNIIGGKDVMYGSDDTLTLNINQDEDIMHDINVQGYETINIVTSAEGGEDVTHTIDLTADEVTTLNLSGDAAVILGEDEFNLNQLRSVETLTSTIDNGADAGVMADISGAEDEHGQFVTTGAGDDVIITGAGDDTISVGAGADSVTGGNGADQIDLGIDDGAADTLVYENQSESTAVNLDNVTGFSTGLDHDEDVIDLSALRDVHGDLVIDPLPGIIPPTVIPGAGPAQIIGEYDQLSTVDDFALVEASFTQDGTNSEGILLSNETTQRVYIDGNADGEIDTTNDMVINLDGVADLTDADINAGMDSMPV